MPRIFESDINPAATQLFTQEDQTKPVAAEQTPSALDVADAALRKENYVTRFVYGERNPYAGQKPNPDFTPDITGYEDHHDWFTEANSKQEEDWIKRQIDKDRQYDDTLKRAGGWGTAASIVAGMITPDIAIGGGAVGRAVKGGQYVKAAAEGAAVGALSGTLYGAGQNIGNPSRDNLDIVKDAGLFTVAGAVLGPAIHGAGQLLRKKPGTIPQAEPIPDHVPTNEDVTRTAQGIGEHTRITRENLAAPDINDAQAERLTREIEAAQGVQHNQTALVGDDLVEVPDRRPPTVSEPYVAPQVGDMNLVGAFGAQKVHLNQAAVSLANSPFLTAKIAAQKLFRDLRWRKGNMDGTYTTMHSAESEIERLGQGAQGQALEQLDTAYNAYAKAWDQPVYSQYVTQKVGKNRKLTKSEFAEEVGIAMRNADSHVIREVEQVARTGRRVVDGIADEAERLGLLDRSGNLKGTAMSYFGRAYDTKKIIAQPFAFRKLVADEFERSNPTWTRAEVDEAASKVYDHIVNGGGSQLVNLRTIHIDTNGNIIPLGKSSRSSFGMERKLEIDDSVLEPFLDSNFENFIRRYTGTLSHQIALTKMIGDVTGEKLIQSLRAEASAMSAKIEQEAITAAEKEAKQIKLNKELEDTVYMLQNGVALLNGTYKQNNTSSKFAATLARSVLTWNYLTKMGGAAISSLADPTKNVLVFGLAPTLKHAIPAIRQVVGKWAPSVKDPAFDAIVQANKRISIGIESVLHSRQIAMNDLLDQYAAGNAFTRTLDMASQKMGKWNLLDQLTDFQKQWTGAIANDEILRSTIAELAGTATERELQNLRRFGIDQQMSARIANEFQSGVQRGHNLINDGFHVTDTAMWADREAAETLERALVTVSHSVVYNPSAGAKVIIPQNFVGKEMESMITQFMSFNLGAHVQHFVPMLQKFDTATFNFILVSALMGAVVYEIKSGLRNATSKDKPKERNVKESVYDAVSESGLAPMPFVLNSLLSGVSSKQVDARKLFSDDDRPTLQATNFNAGSVFGPAGQTAGSIYGVGMDIFNDVEDRQTLKKARSLIPYNNLFYMRWLFDKGEQWAQDEMDLPDRALITITKKKQ